MRIGTSAASRLIRVQLVGAGSIRHAERAAAAKIRIFFRRTRAFGVVRNEGAGSRCAGTCLAAFAMTVSSVLVVVTGGAGRPGPSPVQQVGREEFDARFPGLLALVLAEAQA